MLDAAKLIVYQEKEKQKRHEDFIAQAKYATTEACVLCDNHVQSWARPKSDGCDKCHVGKLIEMIKEIERNGVQGKR